mmetsp:Transcript_40428/g.114484  ORF Transcript_40428/g.114484 Transcript_40428/m.114484 type:complete len:222 (-) Transcript_40428:207-872(-)
MSRAALSALAIVLLAAVSADASGTIGRQLKQCHIDSCGVWCGPPRIPPCGNSGGGGYGGGGHPSKPPSNPYSPPSNPSWSPSNPSWAPSNPSWPPSHPSSPPVEPPVEQGCIGGLPFGLENCVCDGAEIGSAAGLAACGAVAQECGDSFAPFSAVESVQRICDSFAVQACLSSAQNAPVINRGCGELLKGTRRCSSSKALQIFADNLDFACSPLCPDCPRG